MKKLSDYEHLYKDANYVNGKIVLRNLSDMTEEERKELNLMFGGEYFNDIPDSRLYWECKGEVIVFFLKSHFDIFNLIEAGLAIDKSKM